MFLNDFWSWWTYLHYIQPSLHWKLVFNNSKKYKFQKPKPFYQRKSLFNQKTWFSVFHKIVSATTFPYPVPHRQNIVNNSMYNICIICNCIDYIVFVTKTDTKTLFVVVGFKELWNWINYSKRDGRGDRNKNFIEWFEWFRG